MRNLIMAAGVLVAMAGSMPGVAQTGAAVVSKPGAAGAVQTSKITASITAINSSTREVSLKGPAGKEVTVVAGPDVLNFSQMKVGDQVIAEYVEALTLELKKGGGKTVGVTDHTNLSGAKTGQRPAGSVDRQVTIVADVVALDAARQIVTLRGAKETVELKVRDPEQFKLVAKGDQVEATYMEALAVSVTPVKAAGK